jgi:GNAT superfamily N-acetyltransferase
MSSLPSIEELLRRERAYYDVLSRCERRAWGIIGLDADNPGSPHSNHAYLERRLPSDQFSAVLIEVANYYGISGIEPRLRFHMPPNDAVLVLIARECGWKTESHQEMWRAWPARADCWEPRTVPGLALALVGPEALDELAAVTKEGADPRTADARARRWTALVADTRTECLLARIKGEPAAVLACVWRDRWGCIEGVRTRERFRRHGICTAMMRTIQRLAIERNAAGLLLYTVVEAADRVYARVGFELVARLRRVSAWMPTLA